MERKRRSIPRDVDDPAAEQGREMVTLYERGFRVHDCVNSLSEEEVQQLNRLVVSIRKKIIGND
jgi:hypothetical protein